MIFYFMHPKFTIGYSRRGNTNKYIQECIKFYTEEFKKIQCLLDIRKIRKNKKRTSSCSYLSSRALFEFEKSI